MNYRAFVCSCVFCWQLRVKITDLKMLPELRVWTRLSLKVIRVWIWMQDLLKEFLPLGGQSLLLAG